jgi:2-polyprenyl-6-methoxyphenol hydroxylase-like FAD-dependent oxidoreductase
MALLHHLDLTCDDGTTLSARDELRLAWQWAEHEQGRRQWRAMNSAQRFQAAAHALATIQSTYTDALGAGAAEGDPVELSLRTLVLN